MVKLEKERPCSYNHRLRCTVRRKLCPFRDGAFLRLAYRYLASNRTPKSPEFLAGSKKTLTTNISRLFQQEKVADLGLIFKDYDLVKRFFAQGKVSRRMCREFRRYYRKYLLRKRDRELGIDETRERQGTTTKPYREPHYPQHRPQQNFAASQTPT
jgi:hypothetical protein